ncbi:MAG: divalent metal cation transporter [Gemmatimonadota bacterium]|nr:divalent metal cation transporter [Gemmatimonadota bacterium]
MSDPRIVDPREGDATDRRASDRRVGVRDPERASGGPLRRIWNAIGPGVITGAADDDPSGIATYSVAGAQFGTALLWTALITWPLMAAVQTMCARIGMVTGRGLMSALRRKVPRPVLVIAAVALFGANTINVGADLSGMADAAELLTGVDSHVWVVVFGALIAVATIRLRYISFARALKWLALVLFAYVADALIVGPDWRSMLHDTVVPSLPHGGAMWGMLVAILGTTISPYLFFWQASQEVEEEKSLGRRRVADRVGATRQEIRTRKLDVGAGTLFSNLAMYFIILAAAVTLHQHGMMHPETSRDVAQALTPLAGRFAALLYTIGLIGTGVLAIPTLAGSAAYAFAEIFGWRQGMDEPYPRARAFYSAFAVSIALGVILDFLDVNPVKALYLTAVLNGLLAPFLLIGVLVVASDPALMAGQPSSRLGRAVVAITTIAMFGAAIGMLVF